MDKVYYRINWVNQPSTATALGATNLNKIDIALNIVDDRVVGMSTTKLDTSVGNGLVKNITVDANGVFTIEKLDGTTTTYDTKLEKIAVNFEYDAETQQLVITLDDGTKQYVDMSELITEYEFVDTETIAFARENGNIKASVKNGSITAEKLQPNYLADVTLQAQKANASAQSSLESANTSKRYAVGGVVQGDATDNAKYYMEQARIAKDQAVDISNVGVAGTTKLGLVKGNGNVEVEQTDGAMWADVYKDKGTATGEFINFTKSDNALTQVNIKGKSIQVITDGTVKNSNLLSIGVNSTTINGLTYTVNSDKSITINGTSTARYYFDLSVAHFLLKANTAYTLSLNNDKANASVQLLVDTTEKASYYALSASVLNAVLTKTPTAEVSCTRVRIYIPENVTVDNLTVKVQLEEGSTATKYAPYNTSTTVSSPSPESPSPIISPSNFDLVSNNGNWFDISKATAAYSVVYDQINKTFTSIQSLAWSRLYNDFAIPVKPNTKYMFTVKVQQVGENTNSLGVYVYKEVNGTTPIANQGTTAREYTFNIPFTSGSNGIICIRCNTTNISAVTNLKSIWSEFNLIEDVVATPYTPYKEDRINIPLDMGEWNEIKDGSYVKGAETLTLNGSETGWYGGTVSTGSPDYIYAWCTMYDSIMPNERYIGFCDKAKVYDTLLTETVVNTDSISMSYDFDATKIRVMINKNRLETQDLSGVKKYLSINPFTLRVRRKTQIVTPLNTYLTTYDNITNIYTTATPQLELTATFKSEAWADNYKQNLALDKKADKANIVNDFTTTVAGYMADARTVKTLHDLISDLQKGTIIKDARDTNKKPSQYPFQKRTLEFNVSMAIGLPVVNNWQCVVETSSPWVDLSGTSVQKAFGYDENYIYREYVRYSSDDMWGDWGCNNINIIAVSGSVSIASLLTRTEIGGVRKFTYINPTISTNNLPSDYPQNMKNANCTFNPLVEINRISNGIMYVKITSPNHSTGIPKTITGYYNGAFYWDNINSDLINNGAVSYASGFSDYSASFATSLRKSGNVISLVINCNKSSNFEIGASVKIMDLPTGYRPTTNVTFAGDNCTFLVGSDGTVYATPKSGITTLVSGSVSYIN